MLKESGCIAIIYEPFLVPINVTITWQTWIKGSQVTMNFSSTCTEQICTNAWIKQKLNVQTHIYCHMRRPKTQICKDWALRRTAIVSGVQRGGGGCYLTQQTLPMCLTTTQLDPCCCISVFLMRHPHVSNVNLISEVTSSGVFKNLLHNFYTGVGFWWSMQITHYTIILFYESPHILDAINSQISCVL